MAFPDLVAACDRACQTHLGSVSVVYAPGVGAPVTVSGIFDEEHVVVDPGAVGVESVGPVVWLRLEDLPTDPNDDTPTLTIGGVSYDVIERSTDGEAGGTIRLHLHRVAELNG